MQKIVGIKFRQSGKAYSYDPVGLGLEVADKVVVDSASMLCIGEVAFIKTLDNNEISEPLKPIIRKATAEDIEKYIKLKEKAEADIFVIRGKVRELGLEMKIVSAEYSLDQSKIIIEFSAEERVDFRDLLKELARALKVRIELHQVGQRDEVKIKGGLGPCGEVCCCTRFLKDFEHVTVKMAKNQGLSLSPTKISGLCGRLMCCLAYENKTYEEILKRMPKVNSKIKSPKGEGVVVYNDILRERVSVKVQTGEDSFTIYDFSLAELNGEAQELPPVKDNLAVQENVQLKTFLKEKPKAQSDNNAEKVADDNLLATKKIDKQFQNKPIQNKNHKIKNNPDLKKQDKTDNNQNQNKKPSNKKRRWHFGEK